MAGAGGYAGLAQASPCSGAHEAQSAEQAKRVPHLGKAHAVLARAGQAQADSQIFLHLKVLEQATDSLQDHALNSRAMPFYSQQRNA